MLLAALDASTTPDWMKTLPAIATLRTIWEQQFEPREQGGQWRPEPALPAAELINSPYDLDARYGKKRTTVWVGYKVHFTQTCDEDAPQLITHVETTQAPISDEGTLSAIHIGLAEKNLLAIRNISSMQAMSRSPTWSMHRQIMGETWLARPGSTHWYQAETGYDLTHFSIDWQAEAVTCPQGRISSSWTPVQDAGKSLIKVKFSKDVIVKSALLGLLVRERLGAA